MELSVNDKEKQLIAKMLDPAKTGYLKNVLDDIEN